MQDAMQTWAISYESHVASALDAACAIVLAAMANQQLLAKPRAARPTPYWPPIAPAAIMTPERVKAIGREEMKPTPTPWMRRVDGPVMPAAPTERVGGCAEVVK